MPTLVVSGPFGVPKPKIVGSDCALFVREDPMWLARVSARASVDVRLPMWESEQLLMIAFAIRIDQQDLFTYRTWIDGSSQPGVRVLRALSQQKRIDIMLGDRTVEKRYTARNTLTRKAVALIRRLERWKSWTSADFAEACARMDRRYPSAVELWHDGRNR